jgi:phosphoglucomutase
MLTLTAEENSDWTILLDGEVICSKDTKDSIFKVETSKYDEFARVYSTYQVEKVDKDSKRVYLKTY